MLIRQRWICNGQQLSNVFAQHGPKQIARSPQRNTSRRSTAPLPCRAPFDRLTGEHTVSSAVPGFTRSYVMTIEYVGVRVIISGSSHACVQMEHCTDALAGCARATQHLSTFGRCPNLTS